MQLADGDVERCARSAECHVAEKLLPDHEGQVREGTDVEAGIAERLLNALHALGQAAAHFADANQAHAFVVHVPRLRDGRAEALGDPDHDVLLAGSDGRPARLRRARSGTP